MPYLTALTPRVAWSLPEPERDRPVLGAIIGQQHSLIIDSGASPAHARQFRNGLIELNAAEPGYLALTHWHWDHVFGTSLYSIPIIGHAETRQHLQEMARLDWRDNALNSRVAAGQETASSANHMRLEMSNAERGTLVIIPPDVVFTDGVEVDLGGVTAQVFHVGGDHTEDSSVVYSPEERVAFLGDCFYSGTREGKSYYTAAGLFPLLDKLESLDAAYYLLAHDPEPWPRAHFLHEAYNLRRTGELVEKVGPNRDLLTAQLPGVLRQPLEDYHFEDLDSFINGLEVVK